MPVATKGAGICTLGGSGSGGSTAHCCFVRGQLPIPRHLTRCSYSVCGPIGPPLLCKFRAEPERAFRPLERPLFHRIIRSGSPPVKRKSGQNALSTSHLTKCGMLCYHWATMNEVYGPDGWGRPSPEWRSPRGPQIEGKPSVWVCLPLARLCTPSIF